MTEESQRIAIAEACGWKNVHDNGWIPDYLSDLNACHEMEKVLNHNQRIEYAELLMQMCKPDLRKFGSTFATASQRAEAFLRTIGKWEDGK